MKVNDVLRKGEVALRILVIKDDLCLCINCNAETMPSWMPANSLEDYTSEAAPVIDTNMTARQKQAAHERFTMIAPMLVFLTDDKERNRIRNRISEEHDISKQTLRRYLDSYIFSVVMIISFIILGCYLCRTLLLFLIDLLYCTEEKTVYFFRSEGWNKYEFFRKKCFFVWPFGDGKMKMFLTVPISCLVAEKDSVEMPPIRKRIRIKYYRFSKILSAWELAE